eukprot:jgi/Bigna1/78922/fgenesh1_pg.58_\
MCLHQPSSKTAERTGSVNLSPCSQRRLSASRPASVIVPSGHRLTGLLFNSVSHGKPRIERVALQSYLDIFRGVLRGGAKKRPSTELFAVGGGGEKRNKDAPDHSSADSIDACTKEDRYEEAFALLERLVPRLRNSSVKSKEKLLLARYQQVLFLCAGEGRLPILEEIMEALQSAYDEKQFYSKTIGVRIRAYSLNGEEGFQTALKLYKDMVHNRNLKPDRRIFSPMLEACRSMGLYDLACDLYNDGTAHKIPWTDVEFQTMLKITAQMPGNSPKRVMMIRRILEDINAQLTVVGASLKAVPYSLIRHFLHEALAEHFQKLGYTIREDLRACADGTLTGEFPANSPKNSTDTDPYSKAALEIFGTGKKALALPSYTMDEAFVALLKDELLLPDNSKAEDKFQNKIRGFVRKLETEQGAEVWIDAANVGFFKQGGSFCYEQVDEVYEHFKNIFQKTRLVLNENRANWPYLGKKEKERQKRESAQTIVEKWRKEGALYLTPSGLNDDHFWMYGAIRSANDFLRYNSDDGRSRVYLVSNDLLRDHRIHKGLEAAMNAYIETAENGVCFVRAPNRSAPHEYVAYRAGAYSFALESRFSSNAIIGEHEQQRSTQRAGLLFSFQICNPAYTRTLHRRMSDNHKRTLRCAGKYFRMFPYIPNEDALHVKVSLEF